VNGYLDYLIQGGFAVGILGFMWKMSIDSDKKIATVFTRFDNHKKVVKEEHVSKDVCDIVRTQLGNDIKEIKGDVKLLLRKNGFKD